MKKEKLSTHVIVISLLVLIVLLSLACQVSIPGISQNPPTLTPLQPPTPMPIIPGVEKTVEKEWRAAVLTPLPSGSVQLKINEQQLTSLLVANARFDQNIAIANPVVKLRNNQADITGTVTMNGISLNIRIVVEPSVNANGKVQTKIVLIDLGMFPVPGNLTETISIELNRIIDEYVTQSNNSFKVENITIKDGEMIITGRPR